MIILMNPPYNGNLHLKILEEAMKHSDNVVNLSPVRWLQDPLAKYKKNTDLSKFENSIAKKLTSLEVIDTVEAQKIFQSGQASDLGIYLISKNNKNIFDYKALSKNEIIEKVYSKMSKENVLMTKNVEAKEPSKFSAKLPYIHGHPGNKDFADITSADYDLFCSTEITGAGNSFISFYSEDERKHFYDSLWTGFMRYLNVSSKVSLRRVLELPYMGNEINPRTGLKGYKSEWTDEDFYKFFDLTDDEIKIIESFCSTTTK